MNQVYDAYSAYYDVLYQDMDDAAEAAYVLRLLREAKPDVRSVLELGSGTGKHAALLVEEGLRVHGVERSETMLAEARARLGHLATFTQGDIREVKLDQTFDAVISLFHVISYLPENVDVLAALHAARAHLRPGGVLLFDIWYGPAVLAQRPERRVKEMSNARWSVTRHATPTLHANQDWVDVHYDVTVTDRNGGDRQSLSEDHRMRYFFLPELDLFLSHTGFARERAEEWLSGKEPGGDTWGVCIVARAI